MQHTHSPLDPVEVERRLALELPHWRLEDGWIRRRFRTQGWKSTLMVINTVGHLAEAAWHHPDLAASYAFVIVKLQTHSANGVTELDFALAHKIETVVGWQPAREVRKRSTGRGSTKSTSCPRASSALLSP